MSIVIATTCFNLLYLEHVKCKTIRFEISLLCACFQRPTLEAIMRMFGGHLRMQSDDAPVRLLPVQWVIT